MTERGPLLPIYRADMARRVKSTVAWSVAMAAVGTLYLSLWGSMYEAISAKAEIMKAMPPEVMKVFGPDMMETGAGFTHATYFTLLGFVLASVAAIQWGQGALAAVEQRGWLELMLAHGVGRGSLFRQTSAAALTRVLIIALVVGLTTAIWNGPGNLQLEWLNIFAEVASHAAFMLCTCLVALGVGAAWGTPGAAIAAGSLIPVLGYLLNAVAQINEDLKWAQDISPFHWAFGFGALSEGWSWDVAAGIGGLLALGLVVWSVGAVVFSKRDLRG